MSHRSIAAHPRSLVTSKPVLLARFIRRHTLKVLAPMLFQWYYKKSLRDFGEREDDIYVVSFERSGSTWMQNILFQLSTGGAREFDKIMNVSPWPLLYMRMNWQLPDLPSPRIIKTREYQDEVSKNRKGRFIYVVRNGMDVAASSFHFEKDFVNPHATFEQILNNLFLRSEKKRGWFRHVAGWLENRKNLNVLYVRYEDLKTHREDSIRRIMEFCELDVTEPEFRKVVEITSFEYMKKHQEKFSPPNARGRFVRRGKSNQGHKYFSDEQKRLYAEKFLKHLGRFDLLKSYCPAENGRAVKTGSRPVALKEG